MTIVPAKKPVYSSDIRTNVLPKHLSVDSVNIRNLAPLSFENQFSVCSLTKGFLIMCYPTMTVQSHFWAQREFDYLIKCFLCFSRQLNVIWGIFVVLYCITNLVIQDCLTLLVISSRQSNAFPVLSMTKESLRSTNEINTSRNFFTATVYRLNRQ